MAEELFVEGLQQLGLDPYDEQLLTAFESYRQELLDWNTRINLTAITDPQDVLLKHFLDSLSLLQVYSNSEARLLDIGSGAGFPGLPLKNCSSTVACNITRSNGQKNALFASYG